MNTSKIPFHELFQASHDEQLLKPVKDLAQQVRSAGIEVYALASFAAPHVAALGRNGSCAVLSQDGSEAPRAIVLNLAENNVIANQAGVENLTEALRTCLAHEWGHAHAHQRHGEFDSESLAWDFARKYSRLPQHDFDNLRRICLLREAPKLAPAAATKPEFLRAFDQHHPVLGYEIAWKMASVLAKKHGFDNWQILNVLTEFGWDFDSSYDVTHGDIQAGLVRRAVLTRDYKELSRLAGSKPTPAKSIPPEQPLPPGYIG
jgi:hypothetical protein